ncbi:oxidoreductase ion channel protein IolS [Leuconostoc litchii]|uniref:Aldo/keto reductase n=1 Tax=Leuconostoc litchii TaxID=1981069 RepID=A0A6P2CM73_9LACO|nr:aldo/keto reductase [Leuconostoc litchii]TYC47118.1 aldo/keto reductase [Leuconostoc litchii]GMA69071.1 oxidoreductase ion channel protein IolS [Leuconostoc litchii]
MSYNQKTVDKALKLGLGTNKVGGHNLFQNLDDKNGYEIIRQALDSNIKMLDTAFMYGLGRSEEIIGEVIKDHPRSDFKIATKAAQDINHDLKPNNSPEFLKKAVDEALERLHTDYIDIFYIHFPDEHTPKDEAVAALNELKDAGKIRAIGVSNFNLEQLKEANKNGQVDYVEDHYSLVHRETERTLWPYLKEHDIAFVPYFPLASGLLSGKYDIEDAPKFNQFTKAAFENIISSLKLVGQIADNHNATVTQTILAWYIANPNISTVIPGARDAKQVINIASSLDIDLSDTEYQQIDTAFENF